jgi:hypothetical protein
MISGILSSGSRKGPWWIPSDQYVMRYNANEDTNITPQLTEIRVAIFAGKPTTSITAHQNAQFKTCTNKSHKPLVYAGNLNVGVKGELAKQVVVAVHQERLQVYQHVSLQWQL